MIMSLHYIYKIINKTNGKFYIGRSKNPASRFVRHIKIAETVSETDNHFQAIHGAIKKYGKENFILEIIESCDENIVNDREIYWIAELKSQIKDFGYNLTSGGDGAKNISEESKAKRRAKMLGRKHSEEHKKKISQSNMGRIISIETRDKISQANSGENNGMFGETHSLKTRQNMAVSQASRKYREPLTEARKQKNREAALKQDFSFRVPLSTKKEIIDFWNSGNYTKRQLAEKFGIKYNTIVKIIRTNK